MIIGLVDIVIPTYKTPAKVLNAAVLSALAQTHQKINVIVVNDYPIKKLEISKHPWLDNENVTLVQNNQKMGSAEARNVAIAYSKGEFIAFLDADDLWHPQKLEKQIDFMKYNGFGASCTGYLAVDKKNKIRFSVKPFQNLSQTKLWLTTNVSCSSVVLDKKQISQSPLMKPYRHSHDTVLWSEIIQQTRFGGYKHPLTLYRIGHESATSSRLKTVRYNYEVFRRENGFCFGTMFWVSYLIFAILKRQNILSNSKNEINDLWPDLV